MLSILLFIVALGVFLYFYTTAPAFKAWVHKVWGWLLVAAAAIAAAVAAMWETVQGWF